MKKLAFLVITAMIAVSTFVVKPITPKAVPQTIIGKATIEQPYVGDTTIKGQLPNYATLPSEDTLPLNGKWDAAMIAINGKFYTNGNTTPINSMFNYTVDADFRYEFQLPNNIVLKEGDVISQFIIPGSIDNSTNYPQLSQHFSDPVTVKARAEGKVTVSFEDEEGTKLAEDETQTGIEGTTYQTKAKTIEGYELKEVIGTEKGTYTASTQEVRYIYTAKTGAPVTVSYEDESGKELATSEQLTGKIGTTYQTEAKKIEGYELKEVIGAEKGTYTASTQEVRYIYTAKTGAPVTVSYEDESGKELATSEQLTGKIGTAYQTEAKTIEGYELKEVIGAEKGTYTASTQEVRYIYTAKTGAPVTVSYEDESGKELATSEQLTGKIGTAYQTEAKTIEGYELKEIQGSETGYFTEVNQQVRLIYAKTTTDEQKPIIPDKPNTDKPDKPNTDKTGGKSIEPKKWLDEITNKPIISDNAKKPELKPIVATQAAAKKAADQVTEKNNLQLPATGDTSTIFYPLIGLLMISSIYLFKRKKRTKKEA
ncbi:Internalin-J precursor [Listeria grayi]|uniref:MucBP domain-containing protein n=1 Tax=Listeria grayi TaxID=1641 RepID=UPI000F71F4E9|nr:MucBP domain-containing protein [Listeria grayi]VEI33313.1 Internalin-J precursor [Listeria grayi]